MKRNLLAATVAIGIVTLMGCNKEKEPELTTSIQQASYGIGLNLGQSLAQDGLNELDIDALTLGMKDALGGTDARVDEKDIIAAFGDLQASLEARANEADEEAQQAGADFLAENGARDGVITTESGLQYEVLESGDSEGAQPGASDVVTVHYEGRLIDGTVFDSSLSRGEPIDLPVAQVIPGWVEALQLMRVGDKWKVTIPSELAYGPASPSPLIPPNSVLVFDMELLGIQGQDEGQEQDQDQE